MTFGDDFPMILHGFASRNLKHIFKLSWISIDFQWIWVDFLHVDLHLYIFIIYKAFPESFRLILSRLVGPGQACIGKYMPTQCGIGPHGPIWPQTSPYGCGGTCRALWKCMFICVVRHHTFYFVYTCVAQICHHWSQSKMMMVSSGE